MRVLRGCGGELVSGMGLEKLYRNGRTATLSSRVCLCRPDVEAYTLSGSVFAITSKPVSLRSLAHIDRNKRYGQQRRCRTTAVVPDRSGKIDRRRSKVFARAASSDLVMSRQGFARNFSRFFPRPVVIVLLLFFLVEFRPVAKAEVELSIFTGVALSQDNDLQLQQSGGTDLTFHDVSFKGRDFSSPPYYGLRALWFPSEDSHWGFGAEFFHMKMYANTGDTVSVTGQRSGVGVNDNERIDDTIESFSLSHGLNYALGDIVYRWFPGQRGEDFL